MEMLEVIKSNRMLLVEGKDEIHFFNALLRYLEIKNVYISCSGEDWYCRFFR